MTERDALFMEAMFYDSALHKNNYATKYDTIMTGIIMIVIFYKLMSFSDNLWLCDQT